MALIALLTGLTAESEGVRDAGLIGAAGFGVLLLIALVAGRRIKFDPIVR